jgi:hypothetical protein
MPRQASVNLIYEGADISQDIAPFLVSLSYTDSGNGRADNLQITLADPDGRWRSSWMPRRGDRVRATIELKDWYFEGIDRRLECGTFDVDSISYTGPDPDEITIQAVSYPGNSSLKNETRTRSWENVTLRQIANQIAKAAGLKLLYEMPEVTYDRISQSEETDLAFLSEQVEREGGALKITNDTIVLFDEKKYEVQKPVRKIVRGESDILSYSFDVQTVGSSYASCEITYTDSKKKTIRGSFKIPGATGPTLKLNERVTSVAEANRKARAALRQANKDAQRATLELMGDYMLVQGVTVELSGFGAFDAVYIVEAARHTVNQSGYTTRIELRKVLGY